MPITEEHELHRRRQGRNIGLGLVLGALVAVIFALAIAKFSNGGLLPPPAATARP